MNNKVTRRLAPLMLALGLMATPMYGTSIAPGGAISEDFVLGPTTPGKWGSPVFGEGATITWSLMATGTSCGSDCPTSFTHLEDFMPAGYLTAVSAAFAGWSAVADVTFLMVADDGAAWNTATTSGDIRLGGHTFDGAGGTLAHGFFPPANGATAAGDIHFDTAEAWTLGFSGPGFDIFQVLAHEIGHALGLSHTAEPASLMNPFYSESFSGPQADDIAGMQFIYGPAVSDVPEPTTILLFGAGLLGLVTLKRKRSI